MDDGPVSGPTDSVWSAIDPVHFFSSYETWIGAAVGVLLIAAAIQFRMRRTEH